MTTTFELADGVEDWRLLGPDAAAWFTAPSHAAGAALAARAVALPVGSPPVDVDVRRDGVRVRLRGVGLGSAAPDAAAAARGISAAARDLGLRADPAALQDVRFVIETATPGAAAAFWSEVLAYSSAGGHVLADPLRRDPAVVLRPRERVPPLRNRLHLDVVRPPDAVVAVREALRREPTGPFGVMIADDEGNEVDLVPGETLPGGADTEDWWAVFAGTVFYPASPEQAGSFAVDVARLADDAGLPLLVDLRPEGVNVDSGKDQWHPDVEPAFAALAARVQAAARAAGLVAERGRARFVQVGMDAVDVEGTRAFWAALLGYVHDPRTDLTDLVDPRRLGPVLFFQEMGAEDEARRRQRGRLRLALVVPGDQLDARVEAALAAGGRVVADARPDACVLSDAEGNELEVTTGTSEDPAALP